MSDSNVDSEGEFTFSPPAEFLSQNQTADEL